MNDQYMTKHFTIVSTIESICGANSGQFLRDITKHLKLVTHCFPRFTPPISQFTDKISPLCLPKLEYEDQLTVGMFCYAIGKCSSFIHYSM